MLFNDYILAFNTVTPSNLINKNHDPDLKTPLCKWIFNLLSADLSQIGNNISSTISISTGSPQGCVFSPLLYFLILKTLRPSTASMPYLSLLMTPVTLAESKVGTDQHKGGRLEIWLSGATITTSHSISARPKS